MKLSVIVPCYNENDSIDEFYQSITDVLKVKKVSYELIFVDDGSHDSTMDKLKQKSMLNKNVKIISFSRNFGKESAMLAGLEYSKGDYISIMDADLQHKPETLIEMYDKLIDNPDYDVVAAYKEDRSDESTLKRTLTSIFYKINNKISDVKLLPGASDFRVFKSSVKEAIISLPEKTRFLKGIYSWIGFNTIYVPYTPNKRLYGNSKWSIFKLLKYSLGGIVSFSTMPIKSIFVFGIIAFIIGALNFLLVGNLSHRTIILFLAFLLLFVGVIALYISRIYTNILNRPNYIIKEKIGFNEKTTK